MGWTIRGTNPGGDEIFRTRPNRLRRLYPREWSSNRGRTFWKTDKIINPARNRNPDHPVVVLVAVLSEPPTIPNGYVGSV
jgi:hypothetical protein